MTEKIKQMTENINEEVVFLRRELHKRAELSFCEHKTAAFIEGYLKDLGLFCRTGIAGTGIVAFLDAGKEHTLLLRADMDALPIQETGDCAYKSETDGVMHACGHDAHMAVLLAAAKCLVNLKNELNTNILFVFQPGEETDGGALPMIETGILEEFRVTCAAGLHVMNHIEAGKISVKSGPLMASPDDFDLKLIGKGGHGAYPEKCINPILLSAKVVEAFHAKSETLSASNVLAVISVCGIEGGNAYNVIPDFVDLKGTVRVFDEALRREIPVWMEQEVKKICDKEGASYQLKYNFRYPPLINDEKMVNVLAKAAKGVLGEENVVLEKALSMAGEDFAYFAKKVPSVFFYLGSGNNESGINMPLHSTDFKIDERCLKVGVLSLLSLALSDGVCF